MTDVRPADLTRRDLLLRATCAVAAAPTAPTIGAAQDYSPPLAGRLPIRFRKVNINPESDFECACAADITGNGTLDIVSGDTWYEAPTWQPHHFREIGVWGRGPGESGYRRDFADIAVDVDGDGHVDIVSCDYASGEISWYRNPGNDSLWERKVIARPGSMETMAMAPILGRHSVCLLPNCAGRVVWYELRRRGPRPDWIEHVVGEQGAAHGIGWGDVDRDGKLDILTPTGWWQQIDARRDHWRWRGEWSCQPAAVGIGMPTIDVNGDGLADVVFGAGHTYGLFWLEHLPGDRWVQHTIDKSWSQAHALMAVDLFHDGRTGVLTGKRYRAHDTDPGVAEPLGLYYYVYDRRVRAWVRYVLDQGTHVGTGLQLCVADLRGTGRLDVIAPGKSGLYLFENGS